VPFITLVVTLFLVANPIGNAPGILALIKDFSFEEQQRILFKESIVAMLLAIFFQCFGEVFLSVLNIQNYTVSLCGGILLLLVAMGMIFPHDPVASGEALKKPPFIVPIATPLISGPGALTMIMLFSHHEASFVKLFLAIILAWTLIGAVLILSPFVQKLLKKRGMLALEQLMGLIVTLMAVEMIRTGLLQFKEIL